MNDEAEMRVEDILLNLHLSGEWQDMDADTKDIVEAYTTGWNDHKAYSEGRVMNVDEIERVKKELIEDNIFEKAMTREQINEADKCIPLLNQCREHLDNARFRMGLVENGDETFERITMMYEYICKALDQCL